MNEPPAIDGDPAVIYMTVLRPHRSFSLFAVHTLCGLLASLWTVVGAAFAAIGAWPVSAFLGVDVLLLYGALIFHIKDAMAFETISLTADALTLRRIGRAGRKRTFTFQPQWLRLIGGEEGGRADRLELRSHGRSVVIGSFLAPDERRRVARELRQALAQANRPPAAEAAAG